ncbi:50S ribosomal protein L9 [uncultured Roseobacter sp.]|uniref:50S ribosomal protein L9 n=1 Tax=uncultured Roseobacter sp. TaxID=114847 RepID=UPI0026239AEF|nr:50S ribosomal protein L9 [uncultured Roseobacter sp.]
MQVILLERVAKLGQMGEVVDVKPGYARNFLLPQGKALSASKSNIEAFEQQKAQLEARNLETKKEAESLAEKLDGQQFIVIRSASDSGALYGSVTTRDAAEAATEAGFSVDRKQVVLAPIKELGLHEVQIVLHPEVDATIELNVARSPEEAELQAAGKSIQELAAEEEAAAEFEIAELFEDIGAATSEDEDLAESVADPAEEDAASGDQEDTAGKA